MRCLILALSLVLLSASSAAALDAFDLHTAYWVKQAATKIASAEGLTMAQSRQLKPLLKGSTQAFVVIKTDEGNLAKALLTWGFRRGEKGIIPVAMIDRYVTYNAQRNNITVAAGKDVMLFDGFAFNFDIGQIVPDGQGGDLQFAEKQLKPLTGAHPAPDRWFTLPADQEGEHLDPNDHDGVLPRDFVGVWDVYGDGRWTGQLTLSVEADGSMYGQLHSEESKSTYPVTGRLTPQPNRVFLRAELTGSTQDYDAYLFTKGKAAMSGTLTIAEQRFGFYALRHEEKSDEPNSEDQPAAEKPAESTPE